LLPKNRPSKLECCNTVTKKGLPGTNAPAYWACL